MTPFEKTNRITSPFGYREYWNKGKLIKEHHNGGDAVPTAYPGEALPANAWDFREVTGGVVAKIGYDIWRGKYVDVQTAPGVIERYQHCAVIYVKKGQPVPQGTVLGRAGATGNVTGAHLHFEVLVNGKPVDPTPWLGLPNKAGTYAGNNTVDGAASAPGLKTLTIGAVSMGDRTKVEQLAQKLNVQFRASAASAVLYKVIVGPVSAGDAKQFTALAAELRVPCVEV